MATADHIQYALFCVPEKLVEFINSKLSIIQVLVPFLDLVFENISATFSNQRHFHDLICITLEKIILLGFRR